MTASLDLFLLPLNRTDNLDVYSPVSVLGSPPPRRAGRGRSFDRLIVHLTFEGAVTPTPQERSKYLSFLVKTYYKASGSATAAMRGAAESLNKELLIWNREHSDKKGQLVGLLSMAVIKERRLYLLQSGPVYACLVQPDKTQYFHDEFTAGRGLGLGKATSVRFYQASLYSSDVLLLSSQYPDIWTDEYLHQVRKSTLRNTFKYLFPESIHSLDAVYIKMRTGNGQMKVMSWESVQKKIVGAKVPSGSLLDESRANFPRKLTDETVLTKTKTPGVPEEAVVKTSPKADKTKEERDKPKVFQDTVLPVTAAISRATKETLQHAIRSLTTLMKRMLPDESLFTIPSSVMLLVAMAVPIIVVVIASVVYFQRGKGALYEQNFINAQETAQQAMALDDPLVVREKWRSALEYVNSAEYYKITDESKVLREYINSALDELDIVKRVDYLPAIEERFPEKTVITKMVVADDGDLYLLNGTEGNVFHAIYTGQGYSLDKNFFCGPVTAYVVVGPLVDITLLPKGNDLDSAILGLDKEGNIIGCNPGNDAPYIEKLGIPDVGWGVSTNLTVDNTNLYVLDTEKNAVWIYWSTAGYKSTPTPFFGESSPNLNDAVDMVVHDGDLFVLHQNGIITKCTFSQINASPSYCEDPALITDPRPGYDRSATMDDSVFSKIQLLPPPDASIYLLDSQQNTMFHFSLRLRYLDRLMPKEPLKGNPATAFAVSTTRMIYLALGDQVYYAPLPW